MVPKIKVLMVSMTTLLRKFEHSLPHEIVKQTGWDVKVLFPTCWNQLNIRNKQYPEKQFDELYDIVNGKLRFNGIRSIAFFGSQLKWLMKIYQPDIIDILDDAFYSATAQVLIHRKRYVPHSQLVWRHTLLDKKYQRVPSLWISKFLQQGIDSIFTATEKEKFSINLRNSGKKVETIPPGVNTKAFHPRELPELTRQLNPSNQPVIGFIGPIKKHNGISHILEALNGTNHTLLMIGNGPYRKQLLQHAKKFKVKIKMIPTATHEETAQYMNCMDVLVLPFMKQPDAMGNSFRTVLEAMASALPVIASNIWEFADPIQSRSLQYEEGNVNELSEKIMLVVENPKIRRELGWEGRKWIQAAHSMEIIARKTIQGYQRLLGLLD